MTVSRAFWKIALKNIGTIILYTNMLVLFGTMNINSGSTTAQFEAAKPTVVVFNHDKEAGVTKGFLEYLDKNAKVSKDYADDDRLKDALFYEQVTLVIDIPEEYHQEFALGHDPELKMRSSAGYSAELAKVIVRRYLTAAKAYSALGLNDDELASKVEKSLEKEIDVELKTKADTAKYSTATRYFSFANYSILACVITIICLIMMSFNRMEVRKRNLVSSIEISKMNRTLLKNCCIYSFGVWALFVVIGFFVLGFDVLWSVHGLLYIANTLIFAGCATTVAFLVSQFVTSQGAVSGMMNVIALGSSFLCGAFVPAEYLPGAVLGFAHIMPSYYFIDASNKIMALEDYSFASLLPILINMAIVLAFAIGFALITNYISKKKQKIA